jgi:polyphosphate kinase
LSENISIKRIVDRYLEHGRIFLFHNNGKEELFMGSSDWMNRNLYRRIEVCFPIYEAVLKEEILALIRLQLADTVAAIPIDTHSENVILDATLTPADAPPSNAPSASGPDGPVRSQESIYKYLSALRSFH